MIRVLLCMDTSSEYDRSLIRGMIHYSHDHNNCMLFSRIPNILRLQSEKGRRVAKWAKDIKADVIIGRWDYNDTLPLSELNISVVLQNLHRRQPDFSTITGEYISTGRMAAQFFLKKNLLHYAFFGHKDVVWSEERRLGFQEEIEKHRELTYSYYEVSSEVQSENAAICRWLEGLPKPVAVFACDDEYALTLSEACLQCRLKVPDDVAILGVDNNELICNISAPPLSSIVLDAENGGYELGKKLHEQYNAGVVKPFSISIRPGAIIQRNSTMLYNFGDKVVEKMLEYINGNFQQGITSDNIFSQVNLCRRAAEIRFKAKTGTTVYKYLTQVRLNHLCSLLETTALPLAECAELSGIFDTNNLFHTFRKFKGCTPGQWREHSQNNT